KGRCAHAVAKAQRKRLFEYFDYSTSPRKELPDCLFVPLEAASGRRQAGATELDGEPLRRAIAVIAQESVARHRLLHTEGHAIYTPMSQRYVATPMEVERASV
ncbi:MAG TPA: hypothetical protein VIH59_22785, partial [Candidatus Tectomicrobia bacterium]